MKMKSLLWIVFFLSGSLLVISSCKKRDSVNHASAIYKDVSLVPEVVARTVAEKFNPNIYFGSKDQITGKTVPLSSSNVYKVTANGQNRIKNQITYKDSSGYPAFYIFNYENNGGFVFVSADYSMQPILAFVEQGEFKKDTVPSTFIEWIYRTTENISVVRKGLYDNKKAAKIAWDRYFKLNESKNGQSGRIDPEPDPGCQGYTYTQTKGPFLPVTWGQGCSYNDLCPSRNCSNVCSGSPAAWTGCVATAMAQVIRYWQPPNTPYGYNYASMPATSGNVEVQRLCAISDFPIM